MTPGDWLKLIETAVRIMPALASALRSIFSGDPEGQRVRDILSEESESEKAERDLRRE